jgi:endoglucanase
MNEQKNERRRLWAAVCVVACWAGCSSSPASMGGAPDGADMVVSNPGDAGDVPWNPDGSPPHSCGSLPAPSAATGYELRFDQLGYLPSGEKWAVVMSSGKPAPKYQLFHRDSGCVIASGTAGPRVLTATNLAGAAITGDRVDLSAITEPGAYVVVLEDGSQFGPIIAGAGVYGPVVPAILSFFGIQRCGAADPARSHHQACHLFSWLSSGSSGDGIAVDYGFDFGGGDGSESTLHPVTVSASSGPKVDVEGGWHDAGDYIKFMGTTTFVLAVDLIAMKDHQAVLSRPEAGNAYAGLREEMRWGLDWIVKMLGGSEMYSQVSGASDHDTADRDPAQDQKTPAPHYTQRPAIRFAAGQGANILGRAAAALAAGSVVFQDDPAYSKKLLDLARTVYAEAVKRKKTQQPDPTDFYFEDSFEDDLALGAATLAQVTGDAALKNEALAHARAAVAQASAAIYWGDLTAIALMQTGLLYADGSAERAEMATRLGGLVADIAASGTQPKGAGAPFHYALAAFGNGTCEESLGAAAACLAARRLGSDAGGPCVEVARSQLHWLFGQNPFGMSFMIGLGQSHPQHPQHSAATALGFAATGAIVGGPTSLAVMKSDASEVKLLKSGSSYKWSTKDLLYEDNVENYVVNEPAIDFAAPLLFTLAELLESP